MAENIFEREKKKGEKLAEQLYFSSINIFDPERKTPETKQDVIDQARDISGVMQHGPSPASQIVDLTGQAASAGFEALPERVQSGARAVGQGSKVAGSKFMDILMNLDRPRGALAGAWEELGPEETSVMDDRSMARRIWEGMGQGWREPSSKSYFPEEIRTGLAETGTEPFSFRKKKHNIFQKGGI